MGRYVVTSAYHSFSDGQHWGPWVPGTVVELDDDRAAWVQRDGGCLVPEGAEVEQEPPHSPPLVGEHGPEPTTLPDGTQVSPPPGSDGGEQPPGDGDADSAGGDDAELVPDGTAQAVLAWVGDDPDKARRALGAERAREQPRSTLVAALEKLASPRPDRQHRAGQTRSI